MNDYQIRCYNNLDGISAAWLNFEKQAVFYYFQSFLWISQWYNNIGRNNKVSVLIVAVYEDNCLAALFPFCIERQFKIFRALTWMGGILADYNAPVFLKRLSDDTRKAIVVKVLTYLTTTKHADFILSKNAPEFLDDGSINPFLSTKGILSPASHSDHLSAPYIMLSDWENCYTKIKKKIRDDSARQRRRLEKLGKIEFKIADNLEEIEGITGIMIKQKTERFLEMGAMNMFENINYRKFYIEAGLRAYNEGYLHLSCLKLNEEIIATHWGLLFNSRLYWLMPSFDFKYRNFSPGRLLMEDVIHWCCDNKIKFFDFCLGEEGYKNDWTDSKMVLYRFTRPITFKGGIFDKIYRKARPLAKNLKNKLGL